MVEFISEINKKDAIFGNEIKGSRNNATPLKGGVFIKGFKCYVSICGSGTCVNIAHLHFGEAFTLHSGLNDSMSGKRAILEPDLGYKETKKKATKHNPKFIVQKIGNYPAICYPDSYETDYIKEARVERQRIFLRLF